MYLSPYVVGAFYGALITGFLAIAALTAAACAAARKKEREREDRG